MEQRNAAYWHHLGSNPPQPTTASRSATLGVPWTSPPSADDAVEFRRVDLRDSPPAPLRRADWARPLGPITPPTTPEEWAAEDPPRVRRLRDRHPSTTTAPPACSRRYPTTSTPVETTRAVGFAPSLRPRASAARAARLATCGASWPGESADGRRPPTGRASS